MQANFSEVVIGDSAIPSKFDSRIVGLFQISYYCRTELNSRNKFELKHDSSATFQTVPRQAELSSVYFINWVDNVS